MPTSVLLAVLAAAGLLALAPALVRRYDATERLVAERAISTARVLSRQRRSRSVPGRRPVNPPSWMAEARPDETPHLRLVDDGERRPHAPSRPRPAIYRRRRVLASLVLLNLVELAGVPLVGSGFWIPVAVTGSLLALYLVHLRGQAIRMARRRRAEARQAAWLAEQQAQVRAAQRRRAAARREAARMLQDELRRAREALAAVQAMQQQVLLPPKVATFSYRGGARSVPEATAAARGAVRGRPYHAGPAA